MIGDMFDTMTHRTGRGPRVAKCAGCGRVRVTDRCGWDKSLCGECAEARIARGRRVGHAVCLAVIVAGVILLAAALV